MVRRCSILLASQIMSKRIQAIIQRQKRARPKCDDDGLLVERKHGQLAVPRPGRKIGDRSPPAPLGHGLPTDTVAPDSALRLSSLYLYCSTDYLSRCGAAVKNLAHSASFQAKEKIAQSKSGIKHLVPMEGSRRPSMTI